MSIIQTIASEMFQGEHLNVKCWYEKSNFQSGSLESFCEVQNIFVWHRSLTSGGVELRKGRVGWQAGGGQQAWVYTTIGEPT